MKSFDVGSFPVDQTLDLMSNYLERVLFEADGVRPGYSTFHASTIPTIDLDDYLKRIQKYCPASNECYLAILIYLHRIMRHNFCPENPIVVDKYSVHRLVIAGLMVSSKYFSDVFYTNSRYAKVGGIYASELNMLEVDLLVALDFNLTIPISELQFYGNQLLNGKLTLNPPNCEDWELASRKLPTYSAFPECKNDLELSASPADRHPGWSLTSQTLSPESNPATTPTTTSPPPPPPVHGSKLPGLRCASSDSNLSYQNLYRYDN